MGFIPIRPLIHHNFRWNMFGSLFFQAKHRTANMQIQDLKRHAVDVSEIGLQKPPGMVLKPVVNNGME